MAEGTSIVGMRQKLPTIILCGVDECRAMFTSATERKLHIDAVHAPAQVAAIEAELAKQRELMERELMQAERMNRLSVSEQERKIRVATERALRDEMEAFRGARGGGKWVPAPPPPAAIADTERLAMQKRELEQQILILQRQLEQQVALTGQPVIPDFRKEETPAPTGKRKIQLLE